MVVDLLCNMEVVQVRLNRCCDGANANISEALSNDCDYDANDQDRHEEFDQRESVFLHSQSPLVEHRRSLVAKGLNCLGRPN